MSTVLDHDTVAITDLSAYSRNIQAIKRFIGDGTGIIAVVKANGYGHGMIDCGRTALDAGAAMLAVACAADGAKLRGAGIAAPILVMAQEAFDHIPVLIEHDLTATLTSFDMLAALERHCSQLGRTVSVHMKVDTGMGRIGVTAHDASALAAATDGSNHVSLTGTYSHFSSAVDENDEFSREQIALFERVLDDIRSRGIDPGAVHLCNSAGMLNYPEAHYDYVRPGIITYGLEACPGSREKLAVTPVLTLKSRVTFVKDVPAGFRVSYGGTFVTERPSRLATVPVGYSYGYIRRLSNRGRAIINGCHVPVAGRICMDQTVFDVTDAGDVRVGDQITLIGCDGDVEVTAEEHAKLGLTINYEIVTGISDRVSRIVLSAT